MASVVCPHCQAYTSPASGSCEFCRGPLQGVAPAPPLVPFSPSVYSPLVAAPPAFAYAAPPAYAYAAPPGYPPAGYPPAPGYLVPAVWVPASTVLAKQTTNTRWAAAIIDLLIVAGVWLVLFLYVYPALFPFSGFLTVSRLIITASWFYLYYAVLDGFAGGTVGKRALGLVLVDSQLRPIRPWQAFARALEILIWPLSFIIVFIIQLFLIQKDGRSIGDRIGATYLVPRQSLAAPPPARPV